MIADTRSNAFFTVHFPFDEASDFDLFQADGFCRTMAITFPANPTELVYPKFHGTIKGEGGIRGDNSKPYPGAIFFSNQDAVSAKFT